MSLRLHTTLVLCLLTAGCNCGHTPVNEDGNGLLEINLGEQPQWPPAVESIAVRLSRSGSAECPAEGVSFTRTCWCRVEGPGCDFFGDPPPTAKIEKLCPGEWLLDQSVTAVFSKRACQPDSRLSARPLMTPSAAAISSGLTTRVTLSFEADASLGIEVDFEG